MTIKHNYKCQNCGNPATINIQAGCSNNPDYESGYKRYEIENDGNFTLIDEWGDGEDGNCNDFLCDKCFKEGKF